MSVCLGQAPEVLSSRFHSCRAKISPLRAVAGRSTNNGSSRIGAGSHASPPPGAEAAVSFARTMDIIRLADSASPERSLEVAVPVDGSSLNSLRPVTTPSHLAKAEERAGRFLETQPIGGSSTGGGNGGGSGSRSQQMSLEQRPNSGDSGKSAANSGSSTSYSRGSLNLLRRKKITRSASLEDDGEMAQRRRNAGLGQGGLNGTSADGRGSQDLAGPGGDALKGKGREGAMGLSAGYSRSHSVTDEVLPAASRSGSVYHSR